MAMLGIPASLLVERACRKMFADIVIAHSQLHPESHVCVDDWLVVERPKHETLLVIGILDEKQHPFTLHLCLVSDLDLDRVAPLIPAHLFSCRLRLVLPHSMPLASCRSFAL